MNKRLVTKVLGYLLMIEGGLMLPSLLVSLLYQQSDAYAFVLTIGILLVFGGLLAQIKTLDQKLKTKDGLMIVAVGWVLVSFFGALPFVISASIPSIIDAFFESMSGFTTTGSTLLTNIESLPKGIIFWRSFTHWIGGMGILVFTVAFLTRLGASGFQIFKAESPGPTKDKIAPRIKDTARILYVTYIVITVIEVVLLLLGGMSFYDALVHTFGTVGTGGFSSHTASIGYYTSSYLHIVIFVFMVLSGVNFSLYYALWQRKWHDVWHNSEMRLYLSFVFGAGLLISLNLLSSQTYHNIGIALRDAYFQVGSIITTTGYATTDFDLWPLFSKLILFFLMFVGGSAGSTAGAIKNIRILILFKAVKRQIMHIFHPSAYLPIKVDGKVVNEEVVNGITSFFYLYMVLFVVGVLLISLEGLDFISTLSSVATTLGNVGPGFGVVGPTQSFALFSPASKVLFSFLMLLGRLEIFTVLSLLAPKAWRHEKV